MSKFENEKRKEKEFAESGVAPVSFGQQCFDKNWVSQLNAQEQIRHCICLICKQIANNPIEINCPQHRDMNEALIAGESCLNKFFSDNGNTCPVQPHSGCCTYKIRAMQVQINELSVMCPMQFKQNVETAGRDEEGQTVGDMTVTCDFKGKIKDINEHLNSSCLLRPTNCWFKQFGCEYSCLEKELKEHLIENMKQHFELVTKKFKSMQQTIQQQQ
ncbi:hypothetical protein RFI_30625, partial [Reticulomyxa filosa]